ncbi:hypothetical protein [Nocardia mexicana]|uniref:Uncharacterized protein n=1 Tax=Nocardia mexicana TaxID=279262 RepID=A0A370GJA0_9NOCA|nr:hypothetical protein [Nocardia mexicana]RDI43868.1 hypothetical protein DFR68_11848 [Nocardia mexicana]
MAWPDPHELTFALPSLPRFLRRSPESSMPVDDSGDHHWSWVNPAWIGAVLGTAPL